jgi:hypothetical protein
MTPRWLFVAVAVVLAGIVSLVFLDPRLMISPGALQPAHAAMEGQCSACHSPFRGARPQQCVSCHTVADIGRRTTRGAAIVATGGRPPFHQALTSQNCLACHTEHHGSNTARAPVSFSHQFLDAARQARCSSCHTPPVDAIHRGQDASCATCHSTQAWQPSTFVHARYFPLEGPHNAPCLTCHAAGDYSRYTCFGCHEHQPDRTRSEHEEEGVRYSADCVSCHRSGSGEEREGGQGRSDERRGGDD